MSTQVTLLSGIDYTHFKFTDISQKGSRVDVRSISLIQTSSMCSVKQNYKLIVSIRSSVLKYPMYNNLGNHHQYRFDMHPILQSAVLRPKKRCLVPITSKKKVRPGTPKIFLFYFLFLFFWIGECSVSNISTHHY